MRPIKCFAATAPARRAPLQAHYAYGETLRRMLCRGRRGVPRGNIFVNVSPCVPHRHGETFGQMFCRDGRRGNVSPRAVSPRGNILFPAATGKHLEMFPRGYLMCEPPWKCFHATSGAKYVSPVLSVGHVSPWLHDSHVETSCDCSHGETCGPYVSP